MPRHDAITILSDTTLSLVDELRSVRRSVRDLKVREDEIRKIILAELFDTEQGITASGVSVITIERQTRTRIDGDRLQALYRDIWADCQIESVVQTVRLPELP